MANTTSSYHELRLIVEQVKVALSASRDTVDGPKDAFYDLFLSVLARQQSSAKDGDEVMYFQNNIIDTSIYF